MAEDRKHPDAAWEQTVDGGRFTCVAEQNPTNGYKGTLRVYVTDTGEELLNEDTGFMYEARFGPDVSDVNGWQEQCVVAIDAWLEAHGETVPES